MQMQLDSNFLAKYAKVTPPFGFNGLGELVYMRTYSRLKPNGENEKWFETIQRVVEGTYSLQKKHIEHLSLGWNEKQAQASAQEMYDRMFNMKFLPPGRGLWAMGTDIVNKKGLAASLNNCGFVSTENMGTKDSFSKAFTFTMDMSMLGVGIGFDTKGAGNFVVQKSELDSIVFVIEDTREGWVTSVGALIDSFNSSYSFNSGPNVTFDYTKIRPMGIPLKTFGGLSSGPQPLIDLHDKIVETLTRNIGQLITVTSIVDIMNLIGKCVVSGNVRRTALIAFGTKTSEEFMDLKDYTKNPQRMDYGWTSNNSIFADLGMDYTEVAKRICINGEPGIAWLENMKQYSRMCDPPDNKDYRVMGGNPCLEQSLESYELCCVTADTRIQTDTGCPKIGDVVGETVNVWNGINWSPVVPFMAAREKDIYRVTLSDGSHLDCTDNHKWSIKKSKNIFKEVETKDLCIGDNIETFTLDYITKGIELDTVVEDMGEEGGLPEYMFTMNKKSIQKFIYGYGPYILGSEMKIRDLQILLRRIDIISDIKKHDDLYVLIINKNKIQKIKSVEKLEQCQDTFCFTEPETHKGVFGNMLTHQCLVENFLNRAESLEDFQRTLKFSYLYAKTVTLAHTHCSDTNRVQLRNRRIGCSVSGVAQFLTKYNLHTLNNWLNPGYKTIQEWDTVYSDWLCIPRSIKTTSIKPSGTVSLLAGATPGMHYPESRFYIRRMRLSKISPLVQGLKDAGYFMEPAVGSERDTLVVEIPIDVGEGIRTVSEVSMWEQVALAANMQKWWADNQVSCTVTFNPETEGSQIASALDYFQYQLKGISFLPKCNYGAFPQMPYEEITEETYHTRCSTLGKLNLTGNQDSTGEKFCDGDSCVKH